MDETPTYDPSDAQAPAWSDMTAARFNPVPVTSSWLSHIGYDAAKSECFVRFHSGHARIFKGVPQAMFDEFMASERKGPFFRANIQNAFEWTILETGIGAAAAPVAESDAGVAQDVGSSSTADEAAQKPS